MLRFSFNQWMSGRRLKSSNYTLSKKNKIKIKIKNLFSPSNRLAMAPPTYLLPFPSSTYRSRLAATFAKSSILASPIFKRPLESPRPNGGDVGRSALWVHPSELGGYYRLEARCSP